MGLKGLRGSSRVPALPGGLLRDEPKGRLRERLDPGKRRELNLSSEVKLFVAGQRTKY